MPEQNKRRRLNDKTEGLSDAKSAKKGEVPLHSDPWSMPVVRCPILKSRTAQAARCYVIDSF